MGAHAGPPLIGALFVASGLITQEQLEECLRLQADQHPDLPLGQILLRYGYVTAEDLVRLLALQRTTCPHCGYSFHVPTARFCGGCGIALGITCASCGLIQAADRQRCAQCDQPLPRVCSDCGSLNLPQAHFCTNCAALLGEGQAPLVALRGQRRRVSVLFADILGFTNLAHRLDSEQVYLMVDGLLRLLAEEVQRFGGVVDKFTGDGLMATFGAVRALERHAIQAVQSALAMQEVARRYGDTMEAHFGGRLEIRIGISSGDVVAGELGSSRTRDYTVLGDTVNLASRLESAASPGSVLVSEAVHDLAPGFLFKRCEPLYLKGYDQPVLAYELIGRQDAEAEQAEHGRTLTLRGRDRELAQLLTQAAELQQGRGAAVLITADAGYGKTRLIHELAALLAKQDVRVVAVAAQPHRLLVPYGLIQELVWQLLGLSGQSGGPVAARMVAEAITKLRVPDADDVIAATQYMLGIGPDTPELRQRIEHLEPAQRKLQVSLAVAALLDRLATTPMLIVVEDLHWTDPLSRELLGTLSSLLSRRPLLLATTTRPTNKEAQGEFSAIIKQAGVVLHEIELGPLSSEDMHALLVEIIGDTPLPEPVIAQLISRAGGNPLFLEELVRTMHYQEGLEHQVKAGQPGEPQSLEDVPESLQELVLARYDRLSSRARRVIALASVIGREVQEELLLALLPGSSAGRWADQLQELEAAHLLTREPQRPGVYLFAHALAHETIYQSLLQSDRETIHDRVAQALRERTDSEEQSEALAYHLMRGSTPIAAVPYLVKVGERAARQYANDTALAAYRQAMELIERLQPDHPQLAQILGALGDILAFTGAYDEARDCYQQVLAFTAEATTERASLLRRIGTSYLQQGRFDEAQSQLAAALESIKRRDDREASVERARIAGELGWSYFRTGNRAQAGFWLEHGLRLIEGDERYLNDQAVIFNRLGGVRWMEGDLDGAAYFTEKALRIREQVNSLEGIARCSANLGVLYVTRGEWQQAISHYRRVEEIHRRTGDKEGLAIVLSNLEELYTQRGEIDIAQQLLSELTSIADHLDSHTLQLLANKGRARLALARGNWTEAKTIALQGIRTERGNISAIIFYSLVLAEAALALGQLARGLHTSRLALIMATHTKIHLPEALRIRGEALMARQAFPQAHILFQQSLDYAHLGVSIPLEQARAKAALANLASLQNDEELAASLREEAAVLFRQLGIQQREDSKFNPQTNTLRCRIARRHQCQHTR